MAIKVMFIQKKAYFYGIFGLNCIINQIKN